MKYKLKLFNLAVLCLFVLKLNAQLHYTYNGQIEVKQGASLSKLKNPFTGGFELPQFSPIDINTDGINDLLVFDRGTKMLYTFINDGIPNTVSYTYAPQYQARFPDCNNFCLTYDFNNDGKMDLFVESNGFIRQFKNISSSVFSLAEPDTLFDYNGINIFCPSTNIPSFNDIDNDGDMDILTWDPTGYTINLYKNFRTEKGLTNNQWKYKLVDECWGKFYLGFSLSLGFHCKGFATWPNGDDYTPPPAPSGTEAHSGSTLLTLDIDSDGDYEALLGDIFYNYLYFLKNGKKDFNYSKDTMIAKDSLFPTKAQRMEVNYFPAAFFLDVDNDGKRDIIMAPNDASGASKNKDQIFFYKNTGTDRKPIFGLVQMNFLQDATIDWGGGTSPSFADIDNDGDDDLFLASHGDYTNTMNSKDRIAFYRNTGTLMNPAFVLEDSNFLNLSAKNYSSLKPCFGDLNGDGKIDVILGEANGLLKYYVNSSTGNNLSFVENTTQLASFQARNYTSPYLVDLNRDGKLDLFLGNIDGTVSYYNNIGTSSFPVFAKLIDSVGKICVREVDEFRTFYGDGMSVPVVADLDKDGKFDLLLGSKYGLYLFMNFENKMNDSLTLIDTIVCFEKLQKAMQKATGLYVSPAIAQLDSDKVYFDIMLGNNGGGISVFSTYDFLNRLGNNLYIKPRNRIMVYPNPASSSINFKGLDYEFNSILISDITGKEVISCISTQTRTLDITILQQGLYFVSIISKKGETWNGKFIKL